MTEEFAFEIVGPARYFESAIGIGYTLATGRLFCDVSEFHCFAEELLERPLYTHEFGSEALWAELRATFEANALETLA